MVATTPPMLRITQGAKVSRPKAPKTETKTNSTGTDQARRARLVEEGNLQTARLIG